MIHIFNHKAGSHTEIRDGKETISYEMKEINFRGNKYEVTCKLPYFSHTIGHFKSMKKAEEFIREHYEKKFDYLLQLKSLGKTQSNLSQQITDKFFKTSNDLYENLELVINKNHFPLIEEEKFRRVKSDLYRYFRVSNEEKVKV